MPDRAGVEDVGVEVGLAQVVGGRPVDGLAELGVYAESMVGARILEGQVATTMNNDQCEVGVLHPNALQDHPRRGKGRCQWPTRFVLRFEEGLRDRGAGGHRQVRMHASRAERWLSVDGCLLLLRQFWPPFLVLLRCLRPPLFPHPGYRSLATRGYRAMI